MLRFAPTLLAAAIAALLVASSASAAPVERVRGGAPATRAVVLSPDRVIVEWAVGVSPTKRRAAREGAGVDFADDLGSGRFQLVETEPGQTPGEAIRELEADPGVVVAERDGYVGLDSIPDDPLFGQLWGLQNAGLGIDGFAGAVASDDIDASGAWDRTVGTPATVVADIDSGYRFEHPDLADVAWTNPGETLNGLDDDGDGIVDDVHGADFVGPDATAPVTDGDPTDDDLEYGGHGVHTAGTIGAEGNNGIGITGVAQDVSLMPVRVCGSVGGDNSCPTSAIVEGINYAGAHGARVANMSFGSADASIAERDAIAANPQTLYVISAGNDGVSNEVAPHYPCVFDPLAEGKSAIDNVICVAATNQADGLAGFSNWGPTTVDLGAPGTETLSTYPVTDLIDDDFEVDDFATRWSDTGADGGFARTDEPPLTSYGMSDSPGADPVAGSIRGSTATITVPPGFFDCVLEQTRTVRAGSGARLWSEVRLDGETLLGVGSRASGHISYEFLDGLSEGGELEVSFEYRAGPDPAPSDGAWLDDIELHCTARLGEPGGYAFLQGTSMAAPHVTGAAALLFSEKPSASVTEVRQGILDSVDPLPSLAGKTTSGGRLDVSAALDLFDAVPPPTPALSASDPPSPAKSNEPRLIGSAQRGSSVDVYANATCVGPPVAVGTAAQLAGEGIAVTVGDNSSTEFSLSATDLAPHTSACSAPITYSEETDLLPPPAPQLLSTDPASPNAGATPRILGAAEDGSTVSVYAGPDCAGLPVAAASAAELASPGIPVQVAEGVTAAFSATAADADANTSPCSAPISYTRLKATTDTGGGSGGGPATDPGGGGPVTVPACIVPKLAGRTLARAKAVLAAAACKLGTVRKPRRGKGKRLPPLVVKSSTPAAGARPAGGTVSLRLGPKVSR